MSGVLIIGAGGVGGVVAHKCAQMNDVFGRISLASRTVSKCEEISRSVAEVTGVEIPCYQVDADDVPQLAALIQELQPDLVVNVALPYQDLHIMDACLETGVSYLDTANYEPRDQARFEYGWQWAYQDRFRDRGIMALLGCGFDPGVTNIFCSYAGKHLFDRIRAIDILDCNAGDHGKPFATNFNPEINIREVTQKGRYWEKGRWIQTPSILEEDAVRMEFEYPEAGPKESYLIYHEEEESLARNIEGLERIRFWMTFSSQYLTHLKVLENIGMTSIDPVDYKGTQVVPLKFLKAVLPDPSSLGETYSGKTVIGCVIKGEKEGKETGKYIYNICSHREAYEETGAQAVSYTTGVPAAIGAMLMMKGVWQGKGVFNVEQMDPDPFMEELNRRGLPWTVTDFGISI